MKSKVFKWLYGLFCFVPALAVFATCAYVALNENAKDSYSGNITEIEYVNFVDTDKPLYNLLFSPNRDIDFSSWEGARVSFFVSNTSVVEKGTLSDSAVESFSSATYIDIWYSSNLSSGYIFWPGGTNYSFTNNSFTLSFDLLNYNYSVSNVDLFYRVFDTNGLDNVFYYATHQVENNGFFSWVKGNFVYTGMNDFCSIFNAQNTFVSFYLTYVLTISLCYLAFEVLMLFINMARNLINSLQSKEW